MQLPVSVLFLSTRNSCRSILAEGLLTHHGGDRVQAYSAGSRPTGIEHPLAIETLANRGIELPEARSKSWDECRAGTGRRADGVRRAAGEACPLFDGPTLQGTGACRIRPASRATNRPGSPTSREVCDRLETGVRALLALPLERLDEAERQLNAIAIP